MLHQLQTMWRGWRERRRDYQMERALYKAGGGGSARHGGFKGEAMSPEEVTKKVEGGAGGP